MLQNLHKFKEAEPLARELVSIRGLSFDYGLLGDVLLEQGRLQDAAEAYQKMVDQKPDIQAYIRIANLRWLKGELGAATQLMEMACGAASPNAPEVAAWVRSRLAFFKYQKGGVEDAAALCKQSLDYQKNYPPALLIRGRLLLATGKNVEAAEILRRAEALNPLPEYEWVLIEALQNSGKNEEAQQIEQNLIRKGAAADPRTFALYLATAGTSAATALQLAQDELNTRADIFTHDALAWALSANGRNAEAWREMQFALAEGTKDGRLYFHAATIAARAGHQQEALAWLNKANSIRQTLLPSERMQLIKTAAQLGQKEEMPTVSAPGVATVFTSQN